MSKATEEALQLLDSLDSLPQASQAPAAAAQPIEGDAAEALAFFDEITQKKAAEPLAQARTLARPSSRASLQAPTTRRSLEQSRAALAAASGRSSPAPPPPPPPPPPQPTSQQAQQEAQASWGWGSVWSAAGAAIQTARSVVDEQVKHIPQLPQTEQAREQARKWGEGVFEYVKSAQLDKISQEFREKGMATLTDILNVVAPPISEHEVIQVQLSHDMEGYDGIENLVYRALARIMEQVDGGELVVNKGNESRPKASDGSRALNAVDGQEAAFKLAQADIDELSKSAGKKPEQKASSITNPTTYTTVYLRIQPFTYVPPHAPNASDDHNVTCFLLHLQDQAHSLTHTTISQSIPGRWMPMWDKHEWVEDLVAESLRVAVEVIGQEYVVARMGWTGEEAPVEPPAEKTT